MNHSDIAALMKGAAPAIRDFVTSAIEPLVARIAELERELSQVKSVSHDDAIAAAVKAAVDALPVARDGIDGAPGRDGMDGKDGRDGIDGKDGLNGVDGKDGAPGADGRDGADGLPGRDGMDGKDGIPGENGKDGAPGKLGAVKAWSDEVHYEGDVVAFDGATYQASVDTGRAPPHEDWVCLASAGRNGADGRDGRTPLVRGTHSADETYSELDIVALNGGTFVAKHDAPGECPGPGWQLMSAQGKRGQQGERGLEGKAGKGLPGAPVVAATLNQDGMLTLVNGDGSTVECDFYPILSKVQ